MTTRSFLRTCLALGALATASLLPIPTFASHRVAQLTTAPVAKVQKEAYIKALRDKDGSLEAAQTVIRRFVPLRGNGPSISLVAAVHIGEKSYYQQLQQFLDRQDVVFFEGVRPSHTSGKTKPTRIARQTVGAKVPVGIQKKMSDALQLQFQLDGIRYNRPQFRNSDLDWDTLSALATQAGPDTQKLLAQLGNSVAGGPAITPADQIVDRVLALSASTPLLATLLRRVLIRALSEPDAIRTLTGRTPATSGTLAAAKKLDFILVNERNKAVLAHIKALLKTSKRKSLRPLHSIAVFYGAAHMQDIEQHLIADLGYRPVESRWLTAIQAAH